MRLTIEFYTYYSGELIVRGQDPELLSTRELSILLFGDGHVVAHGKSSGVQGTLITHTPTGDFVFIPDDVMRRLSEIFDRHAQTRYWERRINALLRKRIRSKRNGKTTRGSS